MLEFVTTPTLEADPACPEAAEAAVSAARSTHTRWADPVDPTQASQGTLTVRQVSFDDVDRHVWDDLAGRAPAVTPFSRWAFHRAWWDAYGASAHDQTLVV